MAAVYDTSALSGRSTDQPNGAATADRPAADLPRHTSPLIDRRDQWDHAWPYVCSVDGSETVAQVEAILEMVAELAGLMHRDLIEQDFSSPALVLGRCTHSRILNGIEAAADLAAGRLQSIHGGAWERMQKSNRVSPSLAHASTTASGPQGAEGPAHQN